MGVDFYPCSNCGETFPDCGEYYTCEQEHMLCAFCMRKVPEAKDTDDNGWFNSKYCPTCAKGGSDRERLAKVEESRDAAIRERDDARNKWLTTCDNLAPTIIRMQAAESERDALRLHAAGFPNKPDWVGNSIQSWIASKDRKAEQSEKIAHEAMDKQHVAQESRDAALAQLAEARGLLGECAAKLFHENYGDVASDNDLVVRISEFLGRK